MKTSPPSDTRHQPAAHAPQPARGRSVPVLYGGVTVALLVAVVGLALSSPPPRTPPLAAVNPQVDEQVEVERVEQSSQFGEGAGGEGDCAPGDEGCVAAGTAPNETVQGQPAPRTTSAPAAFRPCVTGPGGPRQTEDPQSPPCMSERFTGDNGGATVPGVTATEIRIAVPYLMTHTDDEQALFAHFNERYEFHGRRLVLDPVDTSGFDSSPESRRALAREIAAREPFAVLGVQGSYEAFHRALAEAGIVSVVWPSFTAASEAFLGGLHPHVWAVNPTLEESLGATGALACTALNGKAARHGGEDVRERTRRFGLLVQSREGLHFTPGALTNALDGCGAPHGVYEHDRDAGAIEVIVRRMRDDGVTTVMCLCFNDAYDEATNAAEAVGYRPEWLHPGLDDGDIGSEAPREQRGHTFGLTPKLRRITFFGGNRAQYQEQYWYHALKEASPQVEPETSHFYTVYSQLLLLASGIQWAGPELTPRAFGAALVSLRYPNPGVGAAPWFQPAAGFGPGDHALNSDFALFWWRNEAAEVERSPGAKGQLCYVGNGRRFTAATMPRDADDLVFNPEAGCR
ncbi:MAG: ABC transporter substrate-binding protein [Acidimicrobiia bacterium]